MSSLTEIKLKLNEGNTKNIIKGNRVGDNETVPICVIGARLPSGSLIVAEEVDVMDLFCSKRRSNRIVE